MNKYLSRALPALILAGLLVSNPLAAQDNQSSDPTAQPSQALSFIVHFSLGENWDREKPPQEQTGFAEHSANMQRLRAEGVIQLGARYADLGMLIIQSASLEQAEAIIQADPAVTHKIFDYSIQPVSIFYPWKSADDE